MNIPLTIIKQDILLAFKKGSGTWNIIAFFTISTVLFAFGIGTESNLLKNIGAAVIWVCALLSSMMAAPKIFDEDYEDGTLSLMFLQGHLPEIIIISKIISNWITSSLPLIIISPFLAMLFNIEEKALSIMLSLLVGTPTIFIIGTLGAALTLGIKRAGNLIGIIILPLYIPTLIFGVNGNIPMLIAILLIMLPVGVIASSLAVKIAIGE